MRAAPAAAPGGAGGSPNATRRLAAKAERTNSRASSASTVGAGAVTFSVIAASDGARPTRPRDERFGFSDGRDSYASGASEDVALDTPSPASVTDVAEKSPPAHVAGFHTTTPPQPGTSNAAAVPAASSLSSRDSSASGHLSLGGTYATRCVGGASVSAGDVSTFHEDVSTKKGSSARGSTNARASSSHAARSLATREAACRSTWPSTFRVTQRASGGGAPSRSAPRRPARTATSGCARGGRAPRPRA